MNAMPLRAAPLLLASLLACAALTPPALAQQAMPAPPGQPGPLSAPTALTLETLLKRIGGRSSLETRFEEKKHLAVLDAPVQSSGVLRYRAPARLEKNTEHPVKESLILDGAMVIVERAGRRRSMPAAQLPGVEALVGGLRDTLGGDAEALRRVFKVVLQGDPEHWQLDLLPLEASSALLVSRITLRGRGIHVAEVETLQADGDRSVMTLSNPAVP